MVRAFAPLVIGGALALGAWHGSGTYFEKEAKQQTADRWDELRVCLLGDALLPGDRPSERLRFIELANHTQDDDAWPDRCMPYAQALDEALATRAIMNVLGPMPSAVAIVKGTDDEVVRSDLDLLFEELEMADLPLPKHGTRVTPAPAPAKPMFQREGLEPLGKVLELSGVRTALDPATGRVLRLLLPEEQPHTCHFSAGDKRWRSVVCKPSPLQVTRDAKLSLAPTEEGGLDLIVVRDAGDRDGIYDASTGLQVLQPRYFDTQTHVAADGATTIVYAKMHDDAKQERVEHFRLMRSRPGKRPMSRRLKIPKTARMLLLPHDLLWWAPGDRKTGDELFAQTIPEQRNKPLERKRSVATLPHGSRFLGRCADGDTTALLFGAGLTDKRYTLLFKTPTGLSKAHDVGTIAGRVTMTCHDKKATLQRIRHKRVSRWLCDAEVCKLGLSDPLPMLDERVHVVAPVGEQVMVVWKDKRGALRLRMSTPDTLATTPDTVLLDEWHQSGIEMAELAVVSGSGVAVMLAQDVGRRVYAFRLDAGGTPEVVGVSR